MRRGLHDGGRARRCPDRADADWTATIVTTSDPSLTAPARPRRRGAHLLSTLLFIAAIAFAAAAAYLYFTEEDGNDGPPPPPSAEAGRNEAANVMEGLKAAGLKPEYGRFTATANQLRPPGQAIELGDASLYIFIYVDEDGAAAIADREADTADLDPATLTLESRSAERPLIDGDEVRAYQGSNIVGVLVGGDNELAGKVQNVIESLP
jgi:hypothetical protein